MTPGAHPMVSTVSAPLRDFTHALADLSLGSLVLWLRLFPQLTTIWLGGWLVAELSTRVATQIPLEHVWLALAVFALGLLGTLGAIVLMLRLVAIHLDLWDLVPEDDTDHSVSHVLAITLLPFLGIYAAVNEVAARADQLTALALFQTGLLTERTILTELNPFSSTEKTWFVVGLVVAVYVLRRVVDLIHEKTRWRPLGILGSLLEAYFLLVVIMSGQHVLRAVQDWWERRAAVQWMDDMGTAIAGFFGRLGLSWPVLLADLGSFLQGTLWPLLLDALVQPVIWLAVAALVFGSKVLSVADLWQRGRPLTAQAPAPKRLQRLQAMRASKSGSRSLRRAWLEFQEAFLGDIDDKYLPAFQSVRLVLRAGLAFLGAYVLTYAVWTLLHALLNRAVLAAVGGHEVLFWIRWGTFTDLAIEGLSEPLRMCLLALAFHRCLALFRSRASTEEPTPSDLSDSSGPSDSSGLSAPPVPVMAMFAAGSPTTPVRQVGSPTTPVRAAASPITPVRAPDPVPEGGHDEPTA